MIIVYTSNTCGYCHATLDYFKENGIEVTEKNVSKNIEYRKELLDKGFMSVPVIIIGDNEPIVGFNKEQISQLLEL
jgi:glutaredoxin